MKKSVSTGPLSLFALLLLTACAGPRVVTEIETVEIPVPYSVPVPDERTEPIPIPDLGVTNRDLAEALGACYDALHRANADRRWLRDRQE